MLLEIEMDNLNAVIAQALAPFAPPPVKRVSYMAVIDSRVIGIPCQIGVINFESYKGSFNYNAASAMDYYGYSEIEYEILDRRGRPAPWLASKLTASAEENIEAQIVSYFNS